MSPLREALTAAWESKAPLKTDAIIDVLVAVYREAGGVNRASMLETAAFLRSRDVPDPDRLVDIAVRDYNAARAGDPLAWGPDETHVLLLPMRFDQMVEHYRTKPAAHVTSYRLPTKADPENRLRFPTGAFSMIAGATGHCKTAFMINLLLDAADAAPTKRHWYFSFEEGGAAIMLKALNCYAAIPLSCGNRRSLEAYYRNGDATYIGHPENLEAFTRQEAKFRALVDTGTVNIVSAQFPAEELFQRIRELDEEATGLVLIDYIGLIMLASREYSMSRAEELKAIALRLKDLAIETGLALVTGVQFNRTVQSPGKMAAWAVAEASDLERAANMVIGLWKGGAKANPDPGEKIPPELTEGRLYLRILKARDEEGETAAIYPFDGNLGRVGSIPLVLNSGNGHSEPGTIKKEDLF